MKKTLRKSALGTAIAGGVLVVSGTAAFAFWTATGTGSGTASTASSSADLVVTQNAFAGSDLVPGGTAQAIGGKIANPNTFSVPITTFVASVAVDSGHATCQSSWYSVNLNTPPATVAANSNVSFTGTVALTDSGTNQDACKGATITITYKAN